MNSKTLKNFIELNIAILLVSTAGVFVRYIQLDPAIIMFWRGLIAAIILGTLAYFKKNSFVIKTKQDRTRLFFSSLFFGLHWLTYFYSLQTSNVAIGMLSLFTYPAITTILEPLYFKSKFNKRHLLLAVLVLIGLYIMTPEIDFSNNATKGILVGVASAFLYALRNLTMTTNIKKYDSSILMFYQFGFLALLGTPFLFIQNTDNTLAFFPFILVLSIFTTAIGHTLFAKSFKNFEVSTASILSSTQPVLGVILGFLFLQEIPNTTTLIGGGIIISTVVIESLSLKNKS